MVIIKFSITRLTNQEHVKFHKDFSALVVKFDPVQLKIADLFGKFCIVFDRETQSLDFVRKDAETKDIAGADALRDKTFSGFHGHVVADLNHYDPQSAKAAYRVNVIFDFYGDVTGLPYNKETEAINSLVSRLRTDHMDDLVLLNYLGWVNALQTQNDAFDELYGNRVVVDANKTELRMKDTRPATDAAYYELIKRINALMVVDSEDDYIQFVKELNQTIEMCKMMLAQRHGRHSPDEHATPPA